MNERPTKLPFNATLVVRACTQLTLVEKIVWIEDHAFDRGHEGAYVSASSLAARWGDSIATNTVHNARNRMKRLGLHEKCERPGARNVFGWFAILPPSCIPIGDRVTPADVARYARKLDDHIRRIGDPVLDRPDAGGQTTRQRSVEPPGSGRSDHPAAGGLGRRSVFTPSSVSQDEVHLHPVVSTESKAEDGDGSTEPKRQDGDAPVMRAVDARPRHEVEAEAWENLREILNQKRRQLGTG